MNKIISVLVGCFVRIKAQASICQVNGKYEAKAASRQSRDDVSYSANADLGYLSRLGRQCAGYLPFSRKSR